MKTVFEPMDKYKSFFIEKDKDDNSIYFKSIAFKKESPHYFGFCLQPDEALNLAKHIFELYNIPC